MTWHPAEFLIAGNFEPETRAGYTYAGLGLHMAIKASPKGRRPPTWSLTHLGSGLLVCRIKGKVAEAFVIASEIADCSDWDFDGPDGWKNRDLELPKKVVAIGERYPKAVTIKAGHHPNTEKAARAVAMARA